MAALAFLLNQFAGQALLVLDVWDAGSHQRAVNLSHRHP